MKKLLIAVTSEILSKELEKVFCPRFEVHTCRTGTDTLTLINTVRPEYLIIYLSLPEMDGLSVLQQASYLPSAILALTNIATDPVLETACSAGVHRIIRIPCTVEHIVGQFDMIAEKSPSLEV